MPESYEYERWAATLESTGRYRVLRRVEPRADLQIALNPSPIRRGLIVSVATTGPHAGYDDVVELAMLPFTYCRDTARVYATGQTYSCFHQPARPLPLEVSWRTGLTEKDLSGAEIDADTLEPYADEADIVIAHGATMVRPFLEGLAQPFSDRCWACSLTQVPWRDEGYQSADLAWLAMESGLYLEKLRPCDQSHALLAVLMRPMLRSGNSPLGTLLWQARRNTFRVLADNTPLAAKFALQDRDYGWFVDASGSNRFWYREVSADRLNQEITWLHDEVYAYPYPVRSERVTARTRFSTRWLTDFDRH